MNNESIESNQFLTFRLGDETFAFQVTRIKEVLEKTDITKIPRMPDYILGMINVRGSVVQVFDLRVKLGIEVNEGSIENIILLEQKVNDEVLTVGMLVDEVFEVIDIEPDNIEPPPKIGYKIDNKYLRGIGKHNEDFVILLVPDAIVTEDDITILAEKAEIAG